MIRKNATDHRARIEGPDAVVTTLDPEDLKQRVIKDTLGTAFIIVIGREDGKYELHYRFRNPCQGGHLRKYEVHHDDCTRPKDPWPGDLYYPFPDGKPVALVYRIWVMSGRKELFEAIFSNESPWVQGFGGEDNVVLLPYEGTYPGSYPQPEQTTKYAGVYLKSGNFDSTGFVNLLKVSQSLNPKTFKLCRDKGMSTTEALTFTAFFYQQGSNFLPSTNSYSFDPVNSAKRMIEKRMVGVTTGIYDKQGVLLSRGSGLWGDRFDYNRPDMACVFRLDKGTDNDKAESSVHISKRFLERNIELKLPKGASMSFEECQAIFKEAIS